MGAYDFNTFHQGSYSFAWWLNGIDRYGHRKFPNAPFDLFYASTCCSNKGPNGVIAETPIYGHGIFMLPSQHLILATSNGLRSDRDRNTFLRLLWDAGLDDEPPPPPPTTVVTKSVHIRLVQWDTRKTQPDRDF